MRKNREENCKHPDILEILNKPQSVIIIMSVISILIYNQSIQGQELLNALIKETRSYYCGRTTGSAASLPAVSLLF